MNRKGFTLVELLAVIVILAIIMAIAIPNIVSTLDKNKKETYISDAKKFLSLAKYELSSNVEKPTSTELVKIKLSCVDNDNIEKDPDGNLYDTENSYVIVVKKNAELTYYVNLVAVSGKRGIRLTEKSNLDTNSRMQYVLKNITNPTNTEIYSITGVTGTIRTCN